MTVRLASEIVLSEVDVELTLLGSLFMAPGGFALMADEIRPEWFSDPFARYLFDASLKIHQSGNRLSPQAVVACLPEDCGGVPRNVFYARACGAALPQASIGGLVYTLKDRWARRAILARAEDMRTRATRFEEDPYEIASDTILDLDTINAHRSEHRGGSFDQVMDHQEKSAADGKGVRGPTTGLLSIDNKINGYVPGQLYVIAGRPGQGKSAFMCSSLRRTAQSGAGVAIFSLEMTADEIACRCLSDTIDNVRGPTFGSILKNMISTGDDEDLRIARDSMGGLPLEIDDSPRLTFSEITGRARKVKAKFEAKGQKLEVLCIDHMGLVTPSDRYRGNKVAEAGEVSAQARALAKELNCCVVLLCQLSREVEKRDDKRPVISDLRWSGEIEQDAHVIGFIYREAYYLSQDPNADPWKLQDARWKMEFLIRKNRQGETGDVKLWCSIAHSSIRDAP
jgi:replicative DNA helicase